MVLDFYIKSIAATKQGGYFEYKPMYVSKLPIKVIDQTIPGEKDFYDEVTKLVNQLLKLNEEKQQQTLQSKLDQIENRIDYCEQRINDIVYELYGLTKEEIALIENA